MTAATAIELAVLFNLAKTPAQRRLLAVQTFIEQRWKPHAMHGFVLLPRPPATRGARASQPVLCRCGFGFTVDEELLRDIASVQR